MHLDKRARDIRAQVDEAYSRSVYRVDARGGPKSEWFVTLTDGHIIAHPADKRSFFYEVHAYQAANGNIGLNSYIWPKCDIFSEEDCEFIEDAYWHIARTVRGWQDN